MDARIRGQDGTIPCLLQGLIAHSLLKRRDVGDSPIVLIDREDYATEEVIIYEVGVMLIPMRCLGAWAYKITTLDGEIRPFFYRHRVTRM